jgi:HlyD family secretion protein
MSWTFRLAALVLGLALAAAAVVALRPRPLDVEVAAVTRGPLEHKVIEQGKARVRERYTVSAPVAGTLARIELHEGETVMAGQVVARLRPLPTPLLDPEARKVAEQRLASAVDASAQAQASVTRAQISRERAVEDVARTERLTRNGAATQLQLDQAGADARMRAAELLSARFAARVAQHEIAQARSALARFTPGADRSEELEISSPVQGRVLHVLRKSEGVVTAGTALLEIGDPEALELVVDVLSQDAVGLSPGMAAQVVHWGGDGALAATVRRIEPAAFTRTSALGVDEQRVNVILELAAPRERWSTLGDGFAVEVEITRWSKPDALQLPTSALFRQGTGWEVFVASGGQARRRRVRPGHPGPLQTEILEGLKQGDQVIIHPGAAVRDGASIQTR